MNDAERAAEALLYEAETRPMPQSAAEGVASGFRQANRRCPRCGGTDFFWAWVFAPSPQRGKWWLCMGCPMASPMNDRELEHADAADCASIMHV